MSSAPSFWLSQIPPTDPRPALAGDRTADVCIVGAGFTGLWTAYELCRAQPGIDVVVLESERVGFGASGRNGGWVVGELAGSPQRWTRRGGADGVRRLGAAINAAVGEIGAVVRRERIDCDFVPSGTLHVARSPVELARIRDEAPPIGGADATMLDATQIAQRIRIDRAIGAMFLPHCARIQPAKLATGLAAAAERAGATVCEHSRVLSIADGVATTATGRVRAGTVVRATEAYTTHLPGSERTLLPMNSSMIVTEPLPAALWGEIGWQNAETLSDGAHRYAYLQRTADGRIAIGGRGIPYRYGSKTDREGPVPRKTVTELRRRLTTLFPMLRDVRIASAWHGVLGVPRDWMPAVGHDPARRLAWAGGYVGEGVAAANLAARTLRDLLLGRTSELTTLPWVGPFGRDWEPEPLRYLGTHLVYSLYGAADSVEGRTERPSRFARAGDLVAGR